MSQATRDALAIAVQIGLPALLWGSPGEGKSSVIEQIASELERPCEIVVGSIRDAADFAGLPVRDGASVTFAPPRWAVRCVEQTDTVVFLDELTTSPPSVQAAMLRVVLEREVGDLRLPDSVSFVAAANPPETSAGGDDLAPPLANRFCHLDWQADTATWVAGILHGWSGLRLPVVPSNWRLEAVRWRALLAGFISAKPSILRLLPDDVVAQGRAWPSPRSWDRAHLAAAAADAAGAGRDVRQMLVAGLVGTGPAIEFLRFVEAADLPDPEALLETPTLLAIDARVDLLLAALASVSTAVAAECTQERWNAGWKVLQVACDGGRADVAAVAAVNLLELRRDGWSAPAAAAAFAPVLRAAQLV